ncbi:hypothetical protein SLEP1_g25598 [Rubroshorea leprosula]|uniref:Uncharacterized protein n=1 Tax=Rubroshorea leprosula TaxID=152421 RepID=A0AAV5JU03_9ROSI|nr:hypothetical protein SLEP1_g25598 [Rubroshorea leprosula]
MEVQRAGSRSCSRLYGQKFEDRCLARAEKRRKAGSGFATGWVRFERNPSSCKGLSGSFKPPLFLLVESVEEILEPPNIRNWFSSYKHESFVLDTYHDFGNYVSRDSESNKDGFVSGENKSEKEENLIESVEKRNGYDSCEDGSF